MKRDWDLVRDLLERIEALPPGGALNSHEIEGVHPAAAGDHMHKLHRAGFITGFSLSTLDGTVRFQATGLEWGGDDLLDTIRSDSVWSTVKSMAAAKGIELTFESVKALAAVALRQLIGA